MLKNYTSCIVLCLLTNGLIAQTTLNLSMKAGYLTGKESVKYDNKNFVDNGGVQQSGSGSISMAFSLPVKNNFRLGAEIGINSFETSFDYDFNFSPTYASRYLGHYRINQAYFAIVPEYRILKSLFVNAGAGYYADFNSSFANGSRFSPTPLGVDIEDISGWDYKRYNALGYFFGAGFCPNITKELALLAELRYTASPASTDSPDQIGIGYHAVIFNVGLMFKPKS